MVVSSSCFLDTHDVSRSLKADIESLGTVECVSIHQISLNDILQLILMKYLVMIAENVSVGILSLPSAVATLGMVPYVKALYSIFQG
jgi:hypothetical protein